MRFAKVHMVQIYNSTDTATAWKNTYFILSEITFACGLISRVFANGPVDRGSIPGRVIPKTQKKMVTDIALLNTQNYKVDIKGKVEQSREWSSAFPYTSL